jgi:Ras-related protein Rab-2A
MEQFKYLFKVILIGDSNVGKSSIMLRFTTSRFREGEYEPTIGVEFGSKVVELPEAKVKL